MKTISRTQAKKQICKVIADALERGGYGAAAALAAALDINQATVSKWANGQPPGREQWPSIEDALDLPGGTLAEAAGVIVTTTVGGIDDPVIVKASQDLAELSAEKQELVISMIRQLAD